jgi:hypothetical protein
VILLTTFLLLIGILFALFWGVSLIAQGYLYQQPASNLPIRAAVGAVLVALFLTFWVWLDQRSPGRYDTLFEFAGETAQPFDEFEAARWHANLVGKGYKSEADGKPAETRTAYKRKSAKSDSFSDLKGEAFVMNDSTSMTAALFVKTEEGGEPVRFDAEMKDDPRTGLKSYLPGRQRFVEAGGSRHIWADQLGVMYVPNAGVVVVALLMNAILFVVWFAAFWPVLQFTWGHALGFTAILGLVTMLIVMPLLFKPNRAPAQPASAAGTAGPEEHGPPRRLQSRSVWATTVTVPRPPSTRNLAPDFKVRVAPGMPATAGSPNSRATMAPCDNTPPVSITSPFAWTKSGTQAGSVEGQTRM